MVSSTQPEKRCLSYLRSIPWTSQVMVFRSRSTPMLQVRYLSCLSLLTMKGKKGLAATDAGSATLWRQQGKKTSIPARQKLIKCKQHCAAVLQMCISIRMPVMYCSVQASRKTSTGHRQPCFVSSLAYSICSWCLQVWWTLECGGLSIPHTGACYLCSHADYIWSAHKWQLWRSTHCCRTTVS